MAAAAQPVYTVKNTFIDCAQEDELPGVESGSAFHTWSFPPRNADLGDGSVPLGSPLLPLPLEEGEILDDDLEDGELSEHDDDDHNHFNTTDLTFSLQTLTLDQSPIGGPQELHPMQPSISSSSKISVGSELHGGGNCRPCAWMHKDANGCKNGAACQYCHLCPSGELKRRKKDKLERRITQAAQSKAFKAAREAQMAAVRAQAACAVIGLPPNAAQLHQHNLALHHGGMLAAGSASASNSVPSPYGGLPFGLSPAAHQASHTIPAPVAFPSGKAVAPCVGPSRAPASMSEPCYIEVPGLALTQQSSTIQAKPQNPPTDPEALHSSGMCQPCAWFHKKPDGCKNGSECYYCHLCPPGALKKKKRDKWTSAAAFAAAPC